MPGREDFAIIKARLLTDDRAHAAAAAYVAAGIATDATALAAVIGHVAMIAVVATRETNDGILPGDGVGAISVALACPTPVATTVAELLQGAGLLRKKGRGKRAGTYLVGFKSCYDPIVKKRRRDAKRKRDARNTPSRLETSARRPGDVQATSGGRPSGVRAHRTGPDRIQKNPPKPPAGAGGGGGSAAPPPEPGPGPDPAPDPRLAHVTQAVLDQDRDEAERERRIDGWADARLWANAWAVDLLKNPSAPHRDEARQIVEHFDSAATPDHAETWLENWRWIEEHDPRGAAGARRATLRRVGGA